MIKYNRFLFVSIVLILIFAMPGMPNLMKTYATPAISDLLGSYLNKLPISNINPMPSSTPTAVADPISGCSESKIKVSANDYDDGTVPRNTVDKNYNTRWANPDKGSYIQIELEPNKIVCAIDIAWHRGDVRTSDFTVSSSNDGSNFVKVFSSKSSGKTNLYERYIIQNSDLQAKYLRVSVNGNTENSWAAITEVQVLSKPSPTPTPLPQPFAFDKAKALNFIKSMYDPSDGMVKECPSCTKKWLWSDQLVAQIALKHIDPEMANAIESKMNSFNIPMRNPWATLDPDYRDKFSVGGTTERQVGSSNVWYSDYSGSDLSCTRYADVAFIKAIHLFYTGNNAGAKACYDAGKAMWDGLGMKDAGQITGEYAVYKTALGLLAQKITGFSSIGIPADYFDRFQAGNGGVTTDLTGGQPQGSQNVETTFAVLAALYPSILSPPSDSAPPSPDSSPSPIPNPTPTPDPISGCSESRIKVGANDYYDDTFPRNTVDKNYNTRWSNYGVGSYIQIELEPNETVCAIDIAWHRGDVRTSDFTVSSSNDGFNFVNVFSSKSSGKTNLYERYIIQNSDLQAKYLRITVNGNTENSWAAITEVRILSKPSFSTPTPTPTPTPQSDRDVFNVIKIYKDKPNGEKWFMNMANPASDLKKFDPKTQLKKNSDGSWKVTSSQVRMNVFTSTGYNQKSIQTYDQEEMASKGYMQSSNDWRDVEITGYVKINSAPSDLDLSWYGRGGKHSSDVPCEGTSIKGSVFVDGKTRFAKEQWHSGGYSFTPSQKPVSSLMNKWIGFKTVMFNVEIDGKTAVKMENWIDILNDGNWKKIYGYTDSGGLGSDGSRCGGSSDQIISWGGPIVTFRWDGTSNVDIKNFSVREISAN